MHPADEYRFDALLAALTSEAGCNGAMRRAIRHNEAIEREERERMILASFSEHEARIRRRVAAHEYEARGLVELSWPIVVAMWGRLDWPERARIAGVLALPTPRDLRRGAAYVASWVVLAWRSLALVLPW